MRCAALLILAVAGQTQAATQWVRLTTPNFELYTEEGGRAGRDAIQYFEQLRGFFLQASPVRPPEGFPVRIIAFNDREHFAPYAPSQGTIAFYAASPRRDYIVMSDLSPESYRIAVHEYMHLIVRHSGLRLPLWMNEGWSDVYSSLRPVRDGVAIGDLIPGRMQALNQGPWLDFQTLTSVTAKSPIYNEGNRSGLFYAESWALVHMLFLAPDYKDQFGKFVTALHRGQSAADACQIAYGKSAEDVFRDLRTYFERKKLYGTIFNAKLGKAEGTPQRFEVPDFDSRLILADLHAAIGRIDLALPEFEALEKLQPNRPDVAQALGYVAMLRKDPPLARQYFARAFAAGGNDPQMCLAFAIMEVAAGQPAGGVFPILERALKAKPDYTEALMQLGALRIADRQFTSGIDTLLKIQNVTPERAPRLFSSLAYGYLETGDLAKARSNAETARKWAKTPEDKQSPDHLLDLIEAREKMSPQPVPGEKLRTAEGMVKSVECAPGGNRLLLDTNTQTLDLILPDPKAVEFTGPHAASLSLRCGPQTRLHVLIEYAPASVINQTVHGVIRRLEYF